MPSTQIRIVTDTTAALPLEYARAHQIEVVPQIIHFGAASFLEGVTLEFCKARRTRRAGGWVFRLSDFIIPHFCAFVVMVIN